MMEMKKEGIASRDTSKTNMLPCRNQPLDLSFI